MEKIKTKIKGVCEIIPDVYKDSRGYFLETFNNKKYNSKLKIKKPFLQDNLSVSKKNVFRGLHLQSKPFAQAKLVQVLEGSIMDYAVDIRLNSKTFGQFHKVLLSKKNKKQIFLPEGIAHGFLSLSNNTIVQYKASNFYSKDNEITLSPFDKDINLNLSNNKKLIISKKDKKGISLRNLSKLKLFF